MGRKPSLDLDTATPVIMRLFWRQGFDNVTLEDIADALGVAKPTLFRTFGDKEQIFARALTWYYLAYIKPGEDRMAAAPTLKQAVTVCLETAAHRMADDLNPPGCLLTDSAMSGRFAAGPIADQLARLQQGGIDLLRQKISGALSGGDVRPDADPEAMLHYILGQLSVLSVLSRSIGPAAALDTIVEMMIAGLPWRETPWP